MITSKTTAVKHNSYRIDRRAWKGSIVLGVMAFALAFYSPLSSAAVWTFFAIHLFFFREPGFDLQNTAHPVSPAYGTVSDVQVVHEHKYLKEPALRIGISLSLFVPHVQRIPLSGTVEFQEYIPGAFKNALARTDFQMNESNWVGIQTVNHKILVRQMAGMLARKIYSDVSLRQPVQQSAKMGVICYGSRVECYVPEKHFKAWVKVGDAVKAGETPLGEWIL